MCFCCPWDVETMVLSKLRLLRSFGNRAHPPSSRSSTNEKIDRSNFIEGVSSRVQ